MKKALFIIMLLIAAAAAALAMNVPEKQEMEDELEAWMSDIVDEVTQEAAAGQPPQVVAFMSQFVQAVKAEAVSNGLNGLKTALRYENRFFYSVLYGKGKEGGKDVMLVGVLGRVYYTEEFKKVDEGVRKSLRDMMKGGR